MNKMLGYLKDYKRESVLAPLFKMLEATFDLFVPLVMADIVNIGIAAHDFHYILVHSIFPQRRPWAIPQFCATPCLSTSRP